MAYSMKVFLPAPPPMAEAARLFRGPALSIIDRLRKR